LSDIEAGTGGFVINGVSANDQSGFSVSGAGDVNGDGRADLIVGATYDDPNGPDSGASFVVFGKTDGTAVELSDIEAGTGGFGINGVSADDQSGVSVSGAGDVNGDGRADVFVGAFRDDPNGADSGAAFVVYGKTDTTAVELSDIEAGTGGFVINGVSADDLAGLSVSGAGDVNSDGRADLILGVRADDPNGANSGASFVVFGPAPPSSVGGGGGGDDGGDDGGPSAVVRVGSSDHEDLRGDSVDDTLSGSGGNDTLVGFDGSDRLHGGTENDVLYGNQNSDVLFGNQGRDTIFGGQDADTLYGGQDMDILQGNLSADVIYGNLAADLIYGNADADALNGGPDADTLYGGQGDDTVIGGAGNDTLFGNLGADRFQFGDGDGNDLVFDFSSAEGDVIAVAAGINGTGIASTADLLTRLTADTSGNAVLDLGSSNTVTLIGVDPDTLTTANFLLT
jgi:Ca2+-binding RTX toxin-like protein